MLKKKTILHPFHILWTIPFSKYIFGISMTVRCTMCALSSMMYTLSAALPCWGGSFIAELPDHWFLSCCRPRAPRARGQMRRSSFASGRFTNEHSNPLHRPHQQLLKESNFSQICLILSFGPSEENSIQLEGKDICNGWLSRSGTYSNICNIPILPIILIWCL